MEVSVKRHVGVFIGGDLQGHHPRSLQALSPRLAGDLDAPRGRVHELTSSGLGVDGLYDTQAPERALDGVVDQHRVGLVANVYASWR